MSCSHPCTCFLEHLQAKPLSDRDKLVRSLSSIGGVSFRTLSQQLAFIRDHPEVHTKFRTCVRQDGRGTYRDPYLEHI